MSVLLVLGIISTRIEEIDATSVLLTIVSSWAAADTPHNRNTASSSSSSSDVPYCYQPAHHFYKTPLLLCLHVLGKCIFKEFCQAKVSVCSGCYGTYEVLRDCTTQVLLDWRQLFFNSLRLYQLDAPLLFFRLKNPAAALAFSHARQPTSPWLSQLPAFVLQLSLFSQQSLHSAA